MNVIQDILSDILRGTEFETPSSTPSRESEFQRFRRHVIGAGLVHEIAGVERQVVYADWTASGRLYGPIEQHLSYTVGPYVANTHTETSLTGTAMTRAYAQARQQIKAHVGAGPDDVLIAQGSGMTSMVNKLQRILGLKAPQDREDKPLVIITHMEHHSNQTSWLECDVDLEIVHPQADGTPDLNHLREILINNRTRSTKIGAFSACSNVTGIVTPYHDMAELMHDFGGWCFVDFSASAPYVDIEMRPADPRRKLDAIMFSPHKFLGGPGSSGVLVFDSALYKLKVPDQPGGGTVAWTNPWGAHRYVDDIEAREDGGTPPFIQTIKAAMAIQLKEAMGSARIKAREEEIKQLVFDELSAIPSLELLEPQQRNRICIFSFYSRGKPHNLIVKLLNDRYGIQVRGGCSCAGTYGHFLLNVDQAESQRITDEIDAGDLSSKPGWVRVSFHPIMTNAEVRFITGAIKDVLANFAAWAEDYEFDKGTGEFRHKHRREHYPDLVSLAF